MSFIEDYDEEYTQGEPETAIEGDFVIDNDSKAEWALKKIKAAQDEHDRLIALADEEEERLKVKRARIDSKLETDTSYLKYLLSKYIDTVTCKETKTQKSYQLLTGKVVRKYGGIDYKRDEEKLLAWTSLYKPEFVKVKSSVDWAGLKKQLTALDSGEVVTAEGEVLDCITAERQPDKIEIKF